MWANGSEQCARSEQSQVSDLDVWWCVGLWTLGTIRGPTSLGSRSSSHGGSSRSGPKPRARVVPSIVQHGRSGR